MSWTQLTPSHLLESLSAAEVTSLSTLQKAPGQVDPIPEILRRTASEVQGYVGTRYQVDQEGNVPDQLLSAAIAIARWRLLGRFPVRVLATDNRRQEYEDAVALLKDVAAGKFSLSEAENPASDQPGPQGSGAWGGQKDF